MRNRIKKGLRKSLGFLILLVMFAAVTAYAEDGEGASDVPDGNGVEKKENVSGDLNANRQQNENGTGTEGEKKLPTVTESRITWDGGELRIPVDLGDYSGRDDISVGFMHVVTEEAGYRFNSSFKASLEGNTVVVRFNDLVEVGDREHFLANAGDHIAQIYFQSNGELSNAAEFTLHVPTESEVWKVSPLKAKFDGTQDVTFSFENGTNYYELAEITSVEFSISKNLVAPYDLKDFNVDMNAGKLVINKETIAEVIRDAKKKYDEVGGVIPKEALIFVSGKTTKGIELNSITNIVWNDYGRTSAWKIDLTNFDFSVPEPTPEPTPIPSDKTVSEFDGTGSEEISISKENAALIEKNALAYIQKHYAEQLAALGQDYKITSRLNLVGQSETSVQQAVKDAFSAQLNGKKIGRYYEISITADVLQGGKAVEGLKDIAIPQLEEKIVLDLKIPESIRKSGRTYQIFHYKEQKVEVLNSETKDDTISFYTDSFSPYALVYAENANGGNRSVTNSPRTGDGADMMLTLVVAMLSFAVGLTVFKMKKKTTYR